VRDLKNTIERAYILADDVLDDVLPICVPAARTVEAEEIRPPGLHVPLGSRLDEAERSLIEVTLDYCEGDKRKAAAVLGCSLKTLYNKLNSYARLRSDNPSHQIPHSMGSAFSEASM
jgi:DNA-binding NtrC family response regulator